MIRCPVKMRVLIGIFVYDVEQLIIGVPVCSDRRALDDFRGLVRIAFLGEMLLMNLMGLIVCNGGNLNISVLNSELLFTISNEL